MLAISTAWNYKPDADIRAMLREIKDAGLEQLELGYRLTHAQTEELIRLLPEMQMKVLSVHNFCPVPYDEPSPRHPSNYYRLSSLDPKESAKAVEWTNRSVDTAVRVGAKALVIHAGTVELPDDPSPKIFELYRAGKQDTREFKELRSQLIKARQQVKRPYIETLKGTLAQVVAYAKKKNIKIGLETRYYPVEIPNYEEVGLFLDFFEKDGMGYWHDVGHGEVNERLGLCPPMSYLKTYGHRLIGWHIHGVKVLRDHHAPFDGDFDLDKVLPYMKPQHIKIIESHGLADLEQIKNAVKRLAGKEKK